MTQNSVAEVVQWYRTHETTSEIGFNPDGMCLKIVRTARNIGAMFPSAFSAQLATPRDHRIHDVAKIRQGHIGFFDDPDDSNPFGHVVTFMGRPRDPDRDDLHDLYTRTNSVRSGRIVVVRADYFMEHWGDRFQFASDWLNGVELDMPERKRRPANLPPIGIRRLRHSVDVINDMIDHHRGVKGHGRIVDALRRDRRELNQTIRRLS